MVRDYELMYIVRPDLDEEGLKTAMDSVQSLLEAQGGEVTRTTPWGKRRLAYEIKNMRDGHYVLLDVRLDGSRVKEVERLLGIHDTVFRHMLTIRVEREEREEGENGADGRERGERREGRRERGPAAREATAEAETAEVEAVGEDAETDLGEDEEAAEVDVVEGAEAASHSIDDDVREATEADPDEEDE